MKKSTKRRISQLLCCAALVLLAYFAGHFPFYVYDQAELHTTLEQFFSLQHLQRLAPFALILLVSAAGIILAVLFRRRLLLSDPLKKESAGKRFSRGRGHVTIPSPSAFHIIRWVCMIVFSLTVMFGGIFLGFTISGFSFPVLACPTNRDQLFESSCYFLSHLPTLLEEYPSDPRSSFRRPLRKDQKGDPSVHRLVPSWGLSHPDRHFRGGCDTIAVNMLIHRV